MNIRNKFFSILNKDILENMNSQRSLIKEASLETVNNYQQDKLSFLMNYAREKSKFYSNCSLDILSYPIINKNIVKENYNLFLTMPISGLHKMSTSGSTGTPFTIFQNKEKVRRNKTDLLYMYSEGNYNFGNPLCFLRSMYGVAKNKLRLKLLNLKMIDISNLNNNNLDEILKYFSTKRKTKITVLSYASSLTTISNYLIENNIDKQYYLKCVFSGAEALPLKTKKILESKFNCPIISRYSNQEMGLLAQQSISNDLFELNTASYYFEFLKFDSDLPAEQGEKARIVITDLFNLAMPLIRYDTGDIGVFVEINNKKYLQQIEGRKVDFVTTTKGQLLSPHAITNSMWAFQEIKQFQFIQESCYKYSILVNSDVEIDELLLKNNFKDILGQDSLISIIYVDEIPILSSGKRRYIINKTL